MRMEEFEEARELANEKDGYIVRANRLVNNNIRHIQINSQFNDKIEEEELLACVSEFLISHYEEQAEKIEKILNVKYGIT